MSSCQIDFTGNEGGICACEPDRISRTQPAALSSHMTQQEWTDFCDRIDAALIPLDNIKKCHRIVIVLLLAVFLIFCITIALDMMFGNMMLFFIFFLLAQSWGMRRMQCYASQKAKKIRNDVREVCDETSRQYSSLSFHVRFRYYLYGRRRRRNITSVTNHIGVSIANVEAGGVAVSAYPAENAPVFTAVLTDGRKSPAERLAEIESIKAMLTNKEYSEKGQQIINNV